MDQIEKICERLELGEPLSTICKDKTMPSVSSIYKKCRADDKLQKKNNGSEADRCLDFVG